MLPAPLSLQREKPAWGAGATPWWAQEAQTPRRFDAAKQPKDGPKLKRPEADLFVYRAKPRAAWRAFRPCQRVHLRNGRPDGPDQPDPSLFATAQIAERTHFLAELRGDLASMEVVREALLPVLQGDRWLRIGRGGAPVEVADLAWAKPASAVEAKAPCYLTLTSDLLARDERLRWLTALDASFFGVNLDPRSWQEAVTVHGFNGTSRLWRLPAHGIRRGSVFRITGGSVTELAEAAAEGKWLGERTHEGFGRFRLDQELPGVTRGAGAPSPPPAGRPDDPEEAIAAATRKWFSNHENLAQRGTADNRRPSLSQWMDLLSDLERQDPNAIAARLNPTTAGGRAWRDPDAAAILRKLKKIEDPATRAAHARMFVRWLRAKMRRTRTR